jgi:hypothetical protein
MDAEELVCEIYVDTDAPHDELTERVQQLVNGTTKLWTIYVAEYVIDVRRNPDFDRMHRQDFPDGFLYFRYCLDVFSNLEYQQAEAVKFVSNLLTNLWALGLPAVAACDFEEQLPEKGGYKSRTVPPWAKGSE